jgi:biopolymer transport protein ExbD
MVDMFTLVLLFLLMFYDPLYDGSSPLELPHAAAERKATAGPTVRVSRDAVEVDGTRVVELAGGAIPAGSSSTGRAIPALVTALGTLATGTPDERPSIAIECDKRVSWEVLGAVLESAALAGFPRYRFVVNGE